MIPRWLRIRLRARRFGRLREMAEIDRWLAIMNGTKPPRRNAHADRRCVALHQFMEEGLNRGLPRSTRSLVEGN